MGGTLAKDIECLVLNIPGKCEANCKFCYLKNALKGKWEDVEHMDEAIRFTARTVKKHMAEFGTLLLSVPHSAASMESLAHHMEPIRECIQEKSCKVGIIILYKTIIKAPGYVGEILERCPGLTDLFVSVPASKTGKMSEVKLKVPEDTTITLNLILDEKITNAKARELKKSSLNVREINVTVPMSKDLGKPNAKKKAAEILASSLNAIWKIPGLYTYVSPCTQRALLPPAAGKGKKPPCYGDICGYAEIMNLKIHRGCPYGMRRECDND